MSNKNIEKKNMRVSKQQKEKMVEYMGRNLDFARGQFGGLNSNVNSKEEWEALKKLLNALGGSAKTVEQWKKCWADLKASVRKQINSRRAFMNKTGGGSWSDIPRDLSPLEESILKIITTDAVDGDSRTPECGIEGYEFLDESLISVEILEEDSALVAKKIKTSNPKRLKSSSKYRESLEEARGMTKNVLKKLNNIENQNQMILKKVEALEKVLNMFTLTLKNAY